MRHFYIFKTIFPALILVLIFHSCAQKGSPSGGPRDTEPPQMTSSFPQNQAISIPDGQEFQLDFNEYVKLDNAAKNIIISPPVKKTPKYRIKGKSLIFTIEDSLSANTTYSIFFGQAIKDITENQPMGDFRYVFSTGDEIDSLMYKGLLLDAKTQKPTKDALIMLYKNLHDSMPVKGQPFYVGISNEQGEFQINNMAEGKYKIFALKDMNSNYRYDIITEEIAFAEENIQPFRVSKQADKRSLYYMFQPQDSLIRVEEKKYQSPWKLTLILNKGLKEPKLEFLNTDSIKGTAVWSKENDSLSYYLQKNMGDTFKLVLSDGNLVIDTLTYRPFFGFGRKKDDPVVPARMNLKSSVGKGRHDYFKPIRITFDTPLKNLVRDSIKLYKMVDSNKVEIQAEIQFANAEQMALLINYDFAQEQQYTLELRKGAFEDHYDNKTDSAGFAFKTTAQRLYGHIKLNVKAEQEAQYIYQLLQNDKLVYEEQIGQNATVNIRNLKAGDYSMQLIRDENGNGKWDTGNYFEKKQAERIWIYKEKVNVRGNWDIDLNWNIKNGNHSH